ncbi:hypothetical protein [Paenibacillus mesophilus]|uniref:hypothetical protein n=1 Tax=Paenibacillus mesophilus TaxID=2582849 RepID=UPI0013051552|nr:hypothetical protein [Paenibacillus mesophilus]
MERRHKQQRSAFLAEQAELRRQIEEAQRQLTEIEHMEASLKQWIQRNQSLA